MRAAPWSLPHVSCQGTQGQTAAAGEPCPGSTWHTACQPLLLGQETPQRSHPGITIKRDLLEII